MASKDSGTNNEALNLKYNNILYLQLKQYFNSLRRQVDTWFNEKFASAYVILKPGNLRYIYRSLQNREFKNRFYNIMKKAGMKTGAILFVLFWIMPGSSFAAIWKFLSIMWKMLCKMFGLKRRRLKARIKKKQEDTLFFPLNRTSKHAYLYSLRNTYSQLSEKYHRRAREHDTDTNVDLNVDNTSSFVRNPDSIYSTFSPYYQGFVAVVREMQSEIDNLARNCPEHHERNIIR